MQALFRRLFAGRFMQIGVALPLSAVLVAPAAAQIFSPSYTFLEAVRERDGNQVNQILSQPGNPIVNTRDSTTGRTALHIVVERRDLAWINFLLQRGADPRIADRAGVTPLRMAADIGFVEGARALIARGANVNQVNNRGETALHIAVQRRDLPMIRMLLEAGADPDIADSMAGKSPRDYAREDTRGAAVRAALDAPRAAAAPAAPVAGPN
jgi:uncharacterized protein